MQHKVALFKRHKKTLQIHIYNITVTENVPNVYRNCNTSLQSLSKFFQSVVDVDRFLGYAVPD